MSRIKKWKMGDTVYDVGPGKTSELQNDSGFLTEDDAAVNVIQDTNGDIKISGLAASTIKPKWELIRDVTLEESTDAISITVDDDGRPFELSAISYRIDSPAVESGQSTVDMGVSGHSMSNSTITFGPRRIGYHNSGLQQTNERSCNALCVIDGATMFAVHATEVNGANSASAFVLMNNLCNSLFTMEDFVIDTLATYRTPSVQFPVGTRIRVYGKRA